MKTRIRDLNLSESGKQGCLFKYCSKNLPEQLEEFLEVYQEKGEKINILFYEVLLFGFASSRGYSEVLNILLNYYEKTQLDDLCKDSHEYKFAKHKLGSIIEDVFDTYTVSDKIMDALKEYMPKEESSDTDDDLDDYLEYLSLSSDHIFEEGDVKD